MSKTADIWIVEDDLETAALYLGIIEGEGHRARHFRHFSTLPAAARVDALLFNARYRDPQGLNFLRNFRQENKECKIIIIYGGLILDDETLASLSWRVLRKPFDLDEFTKILAAI